MLSSFFLFGYTLPEWWQLPLCPVCYTEIRCPEVQFINISIDVDAGLEWRRQALFNPHLSEEERFYAALTLMDFYFNFVPYEKCQKFYCDTPPKMIKATG